MKLSKLIATLHLALCVVLTKICTQSGYASSSFIAVDTVSVGQSAASPLETNDNSKQDIASNMKQYLASGEQSEPSLKLHMLPNSPANNVTCNDGSPIGYYMRLNSHSKSWIILLEKGGFCSNQESCIKRWKQEPEMMSSNYWTQHRIGEYFVQTIVVLVQQIRVPILSQTVWRQNKRSKAEPMGRRRATHSINLI